MSVKPEKRGASPRYRPGDIVTCKDGGVGVIVEAHVTINGSEWEWNEKMDAIREPDSAWEPTYALDQVPGEKKLRFNAWWEASQWRKVKLGPLHKRKRRK